MSIKIKIIKEAKNKRDFLNEGIGDAWDWVTNSGVYDEEQRRRDREEIERERLKNKQLEREAHQKCAKEGGIYKGQGLCEPPGKKITKKSTYSTLEFRINMTRDSKGPKNKEGETCAEWARRYVDFLESTKLETTQIHKRLIANCSKTTLGVRKTVKVDNTPYCIDPGRTFGISNWLTMSDSVKRGKIKKHQRFFIKYKSQLPTINKLIDYYKSVGKLPEHVYPPSCRDIKTTPTPSPTPTPTPGPTKPKRKVKVKTRRRRGGGSTCARGGRIMRRYKDKIPANFNFNSFYKQLDSQGIIIKKDCIFGPQHWRAYQKVSPEISDVDIDKILDRPQKQFIPVSDEGELKPTMSDSEKEKIDDEFRKFAKDFKV